MMKSPYEPSFHSLQLSTLKTKPVESNYAMFPLENFRSGVVRICWRHCSNNSGFLPLTPSRRSSLKSVDQNTSTLGIPARRRTTAAMHHRLSCIPATRGFAAISFFSEDHQNVCSSLNKRCAKNMNGKD